MFILLFITWQTIAASESCGWIFKNSHNVALQSVMVRMRDYEFAIHDFITVLKVPEAHKDINLARNHESLETTIAIVEKYDLLLSHTIEKATSSMMSPKVETKSVSERESFTQNYKNSYVEYRDLVRSLHKQLVAWRDQDPAIWDARVLDNIMMQMNTLMAKAHQKF